MNTDDFSMRVSMPENRLKSFFNRILAGLKGLFLHRTFSSPAGLLVIIVGGIALAEVIAMIVVYFIQDRPYVIQVALDALVMTVIITPLLYNRSIKPLLLEVRQRKQSESIAQARLRLMDYARDHSLQQLLQFTLDEIESLTGSKIGFFHFLNADQTTISLQAWSTHTIAQMCKAEGMGGHYELQRAGVWADSIRLKTAVIHNHYPSLPDRKGMPEGHAVVERELVVPILRADRVMGILGVGNKPGDYDANDNALVSTLADFVWDIIQNKKSELELRASEEKFRTLVDWTFDWEMWVAPSGKLVYISPACERISGYSPQAFETDPDLMRQIIHPDDLALYLEHSALLHDATADAVQIQYRILSKDGSLHWIEHICRPLFTPDGAHLGRRISNRDITGRKLAEKKLAEQARYEATLTDTLRTIQTDIARDLHDTLGQNISFLRMNLEDLSDQNLAQTAPVRAQINGMTQAANESYELIRAMLVMLQTGLTHDLTGLFSTYAQQIADRSAMRITLSSQGSEVALTPHQIRQLFYVFREALSNAEKHAHASCMDVRFQWGEDALTFSITDDGCGFDPERMAANSHYGLKFMRERVELMRGSLSVISKPNRGTSIQAVLPYL